MKIFQRKGRNKIACCLAWVLLLTGCAFSVPAENLISPPKLNDRQTEIYRALLNGKGTGLTLKYPKTGEYRSPFVFFGENVFVFYELSGGTGEPAVWTTFLSQENGKWECTYDISFFASDIEKVEFSPLGDSDEVNAVISCSVTGAPDKTVSVVAFDEKGTPRKVYSKNYCAYYEINGFSSDGESLMTIVNSKDVKESRAFFASWKNGEFTETESVELNPDATGYVRVTDGLLSGERNALFIEYTKGDNACNTGVVVRQGIGLYNAVYTPNEETRAQNIALLEKTPNAYTAHAYSRDIDGDGAVEVAGNADFPGYEGAGVTPVRAAVWYAIRGADRLEKLYYSYLSINGDYVFFFPDGWENNVTVSVSADGREVAFWEFDAAKHEFFFNAEEEMLRILSAPKGEKPQSEGDWRLYDAKGEQYDYYVKIREGSIGVNELGEFLVFNPRGQL